MKESTQLHILKTLWDAAGHPLCQDVLKMQVDSRARPRPSQEMFATCLENLQNIGHILRRENEMDSTNPYWLLDEKGEAWATKQRW